MPSGADFGEIRVRIRISGQLWETCDHTSHGQSIHDSDHSSALEGE
jgi:hypothetical protein